MITVEKDMHYLFNIKLNATKLNNYFTYIVGTCLTFLLFLLKLQKKRRGFNEIQVNDFVFYSS